MYGKERLEQLEKEIYKVECLDQVSVGRPRKIRNGVLYSVVRIMGVD